MRGPGRIDGGRGAAAVALCSAAAVLAGVPARAAALEPGKALTQYVHRAWGAEQGMPQSSVFAITQTRDGYLWIGTEEGLARFDGVTFTSFDKDTIPCLVDEWLSELVEGPDGALWMGSWHGGVVRLKAGRFDCYGTKQGLPSDEISGIVPEADGVWLASADRGLFFFQPDQGRVTRHYRGAPGDQLSSPRVSAIHRARDGSLWIATNGGGLDHLRRDGSIAVLGARDGLSSDSITSVEETADGSIWVGSAAGLDRILDGRIARFEDRRGRKPTLITSLRADRSGALWLGSENGLGRLQDGVIDTYSVGEGLSSPIVRVAFEDREGNLWFGPDGGGLQRLSDGVVTPFTRAEGLSDDQVWAVYGDSPGSIWIGTQNGGVNWLHDGTVTAVAAASGVSDGAVRAIYRRSDGTMWFGTRRRGLARLDGDRMVIIASDEPRCRARVTAIAEDDRGVLWVGTKGTIGQEGLVCRLDGDRLIPYGGAQGGLDDQINVMRRLRDGRLMVGGGRGLYVLRGGALARRYTMADGLSSVVINSIYEDETGAVWIGTGTGGLNRMVGDRFSHLTTADGLFDDRVHAILEDGRGNFWMSSNRGIFRVPRRELELVLAGAIRSVTSVAYTRADGMGSTECNGSSQYAGWKAQDGSLWFATMKGAARVQPDRLHGNPRPPDVVIERFSAGGKAVGIGASIVLPAGTRTLELGYTATSLVASERIRFKYMLEGFETAWVEAGSRRSAFYTNLPAGSYRFRVIAANSDGVWNQVGAAIQFELEPHFYRTWWAYGLALLAAIGLGGAVQRLRARGWHAREKELEARVDERTRQIEAAAAALRSSEAFSRAIVDNVGDGIIAFRQDGSISRWNAAAERIFHYSDDDAIGRDASLIGTGPSKGDGAGPKTVDQARRKDGSAVPIEVHATTADVDGETVSIWLVRDLTGARQAEAKLAGIQGQLIEISRRAGMSQVAASVLHNLGNSLTSLRVSLSVVLTGLRQSKLVSLARGVAMLGQAPRPDAPAAVDERARHLPAFLTKVTEALQEDQVEAIGELETMERIIAQIEAVVRSQRTRAQIAGVAELLVLRELIEDAIRGQRGSCDAAGVTLVTDYAELPLIRIDRARVLEILLNLMANAREAVEGGPPADLRHIVVRTRRADRDRFAIDVADTGIGIPLEHLSTIFAQGFTTKQDSDGFGLHSSACLATELGGSLKAHSEGPGQGACFTLILPMNQAAVTTEMTVEAGT